MGMGQAEERVHIGQEGIAHADGLADPVSGCLVIQPGLSALGLQVGMAPEEGVECSQLIPPGEKLCIGVAKEPCNVSACMHHAQGSSWHAEQL